VIAVLFLDLPPVFSLFGTGYGATVNDVRPLLLVLVPIALSTVCFAGLQGRDHERLAFRLVLLVATVNVAGNVILIPHLGVRGALLATSAGEWCAAVGSMVLAVRLCDIRRRDLRVLGGAVVVSVLAFLPMPGPVVSASIVLWVVSMWRGDDFALRSGTLAYVPG
jgi:O-antigen/teichoic acid export membrane protein